MNDTTESTNAEATPQPAAPVRSLDAPVASFVPLTSGAAAADSEKNSRMGDTALASATIRPIRQRGASPFLSLLGFVVRDYLRSPWPLANLALLVVVHTLFFNYQSSQSHFFAIEYGMVVLIAALTTAVIFARANRAETYAILARPVRRLTLTAAMLLASWLITLFFHLISTLVESLRFGQLLNPAAEIMPWRSPVTHVIGLVPIMVAAVAAVALTALLSSFVSSSGTRLVILGVLALLVMSFDSKNFPIEAARPFLQWLPPVLAPLAGALKFATDSQRDSIATVSLGLLALYSAILIALTLWMSSQREIILD
jgi:hypothetical protein